VPGITVDKQIKDANDMGAAMAPAAQSTLLRYFAASHTVPSDYDLIVTGDLGFEGGDILCDLMLREGVDISSQYNDCGRMMFSRNTQDTHSGGSGCGCVATVFASYLLPRIARGDIRRMLLMGTGALLSPDSLKQGRSIPGVAHLVCVEAPMRPRKERS
jgi:stage V sporulation protein AD